MVHMQGILLKKGFVISKIVFYASIFSGFVFFFTLFGCGWLIASSVGMHAFLSLETSKFASMKMKFVTPYSIMLLYIIFGLSLVDAEVQGTSKVGGGFSNRCSSSNKRVCLQDCSKK